MAYTKQPIRLARFQVDPAYDNATGNVTAVNAQSFLQTKRLQNDADPDDATEAPWRPVNFNLLDPAIKDTTITAAGKTVTYAELAALIRKASIDRAAAGGVS